MIVQMATLVHHHRAGGRIVEAVARTRLDDQRRVATHQTSVGLELRRGLVEPGDAAAVTTISPTMTVHHMAIRSRSRRSTSRTSRPIPAVESCPPDRRVEPDSGRTAGGGSRRSSVDTPVMSCPPVADVDLHGRQFVAVVAQEQLLQGRRLAHQRADAERRQVRDRCVECRSVDVETHVAIGLADVVDTAMRLESA